MHLQRLVNSAVKRTVNCLGYDIVSARRSSNKIKELSGAEPRIPEPFASLALSGEALYQLVQFHQFEKVLDVGSGAGVHARILRENGKTVTELDFGRSIYFDQRESRHDTGDSQARVVYGDFMTCELEYTYDCIWASHVLEHQPNPGLFINRCIELVSDGGLIAITVPPLKHNIVGGHLSLWNAGLLLYQLVFAGLDCRDASVRTYGYNVSVITKKVFRPPVDLDYDAGDVERLAEYFPGDFKEGFDGRLSSVNWKME